MVAARSISPEEVDEILDRLIDLARSGRALDLRLARILACLKRMSLTPVGYSSYTAFCRERVEWKSSWTHKLVRLVESDLDEVKLAVCLGTLRMTDAVRAPGNVERDGQRAWLAEGWHERPPRKSRAPRVEITGADMRIVHDARARARLCVGRAVSDATADRYILLCHGRRPQDILDEARTPPPAPAPLPPWCASPDPASRVAGEWHDPVDLADALAMLEGVQRLRRDRILELGRLFADVAARRLHVEMGFDTLAELARQALHLDVRSLERYRQLADTVELVGESLDLNRLEQVGRIATEHTVADWVAIAGQVGVGELERAVERCVRGMEPHVRAAYLQVMATTTESVGLASSHKPLPPPRYDEVDARLVDAARWFLANVRPEPQKGFGKVKERDRFICQNPECGRRCLRNEAHHWIPRSRGGSNELSNGICVCRSCHLRLLHGGRLDVTREGAFWVWRWTCGRVVRVLGG